MWNEGVVDICTLKFGGKKHPWVDLKIKGGNREPPLAYCFLDVNKCIPLHNFNFVF